MRDENESRSILLCEAAKWIGKQRLIYRLYVRQCYKQREFTVSIELDDEKSEVRLGDSAEHAFEFYRRISNGLVTPCVVEDLFEDFCYEMQIHEAEISKNPFTFEENCAKI